ncbi:MAG: cyclic nucleotide-binding domain-containing protein [Candidatus Sumerlaeia bacterium]|nr:cyclic nucleotide-binding domain-containing protein [Candidatus Sumerlaeia bacterium]
MQIFKGLPAAQVSFLRSCGAVRVVEAGQLLFREGDPALGLFVVLSGTVEIFRGQGAGEAVLRRLGPNAVFGEMGLLWDAKARTASARASEQATLFELPRNPVELLGKIDDKTAAIRFVQNLVCVLGERLRAKDHGEGLEAGRLRLHEAVEVDGSRALAEIESHLPDGLFARFFSSKSAKPGALLCREGDASDAFFFVRAGVVEVLKEGQAEPVASFAAPALAGEVGFFGGEPRSATLRAVTELEYVVFDAKDWKRLVEKSQDDALALVLAAAQLSVQLIREREGSA